MKKNMGTADRVVRIVVAVIIGVLIFTGKISGLLAIILGIVAAMFLFTSLVGTCPGYVPLGFSTCKKSSD